MFWTKIKRIWRAGFINFWRNGVVSLAAILVLSVTLFVIASLILGQAVLESALAEVKDKVDINVYFRTDANEPDILALKDSLAKLPEVKSIEYVSREQALEAFRTKFSNNTLIIQSLSEIGYNPLGAMLNIKTKELSQYESIAKFLEGGAGALTPGSVSIIDKVNYAQKKIIIDRLSKLIESANTFGYGLTIIFIIMSVAVSFNTIRLAIYSSRDEISVMRLVGASNNYVRGPFMAEGIIYGVLSAVIVMLVLYPLAVYASRLTANFFGGIDLLAYYRANFWEMLVILLASGVFLGAASSFLAVRRYLRV